MNNWWLSSSSLPELIFYMTFKKTYFGTSDQWWCIPLSVSKCGYLKERERKNDVGTRNHNGLWLSLLCLRKKKKKREWSFVHVSHSHFDCVAFESVAETGTVGVVLVWGHKVAERKRMQCMKNQRGRPSLTWWPTWTNWRLRLGSGPELTSGPTESTSKWSEVKAGMLAG